MRPLLPLMLLILAAPPFGGALFGQQPPKIDEYKMTTYQVVLVKPGPAGAGEADQSSAAHQREHRRYVADLVRTGRAVAGGHFSSTSPYEAAYFVAGTPADARALATAAPGVEGGGFAFEVLQWMGPEGWFQKPANPAETETIYFGFLVTGENTTSVTAEEQKALMAGHLGYMDGQAKIGKLVLAGPLLRAAPRRGLIAYRVPTLAEAVERASADPMIKAGRMKPELYEWTIPRGTLK